MKRFWNRKGIFQAACIAVASAAVVSGTAISAPAYAMGEGVTLASNAMIERVETDAAGREKTVLKSPKDVIIVPGDRVVFTLTYANKGALPASGFRATNPMPGAVHFVAAAEDWAEVSVDGGKSWGQLSALKVPVKTADGQGETMRSATAEDVTHVRWVFANAIAPGSEGSVSYRGVIK
jgi:uncharacterized repeat protein (TIGR01451 family)